MSEIVDRAVVSDFMGGLFISRFGHVQYRQLAVLSASWRADVLAHSMCEARAGCSGKLLFDHCHNHGWIRAVLCARCNYRMGQIDGVRNLTGAQVDLGATPFGKIIGFCPGRLAQIPPNPPFDVPHARWRDEPVIRVATGRSEVYHLAWPSRRQTVCGIPSDGWASNAVTGVLCRRCAHRTDRTAERREDISFQESLRRRRCSDGH